MGEAGDGRRIAGRPARDAAAGDNHGVVATGGNAFVVGVCVRIAGVTGANQAGLAVLERGGRIGALRSGREPGRWLLDDLPRQKIFDLVSGLTAPGGTT